MDKAHRFVRCLAALARQEETLDASIPFYTFGNSVYTRILLANRVLIYLATASRVSFGTPHTNEDAAGGTCLVPSSYCMPLRSSPLQDMSALLVLFCFSLLAFLSRFY